MAAAASRAGKTSARYWIDKHKAGILFILPALAIYAIFFVKPFLTSIYYSLTSWNGYDQVKEFVGLANYVRLFHDPLVWLSLSHNLIWIAIFTLAPIIIGLPLAVMLTNIRRGRLVFQTAFFLPYVLSGVLIGVIWGWIYNPVFGVLNYVLHSIGLGGLARGWLGDPDLALYAVLVAAIWGYFGFCVVIFMAALQNINLELIEAAKIDGANAIQQFFYVIIPQLRNVINVMIVINLIGGFSVFDIIRIMTVGGPANHTEVIATYNYTVSFQENNIGYGTTLSMVMTVLSLVASYFYIRLRDRQEQDE
jgi:multiple sugar transport system permease protein/raffinose/stachyose/melibiose transport system permease protein